MPTLYHVATTSRLIPRAFSPCRIFVRKYAVAAKPIQAVPVSFNNAEAIKKFHDWAANLWFAPVAWKTNLGQKVQCHYMPYWYFKGKGYIVYTGRLGYNKTYRVVVNNKTEYRTKIEWYDVPPRTVHKFHFAKEVYASYEFERDHVRQLGPWNLDNVQTIHDTTDTVVDTYTVDSETAYSLGWDEYLYKFAERACLHDLRYSSTGKADHYEISYLELHETELSYSMVYLPAYVLDYKFGDDEFQLIMNGNQGKIKGYRQYSPELVAAASIVGSAAAYVGAAAFYGFAATIPGAMAFVLLAGVASKYIPQFLKNTYRPFKRTSEYLIRHPLAPNNSVDRYRYAKFFTHTKEFPQIGAEEHEHERVYGKSRPKTEDDTAKTQDLYAILGVSRTATDQEIKSAYRRKAMEHHPDRNPNNKERAAVMFRKVNQAYQVLSDPRGRKEYDQYGTYK